MNTPTITLATNDNACAPGVPMLYRVFASDRPHEPLRAFSLADIDEVRFQRSSHEGTGQHSIRDHLRGRVLTLGIADPTVSSDHARLRRCGGALTLTDSGAKNGCWVDGTRVRQAQLLDGMWIETGSQMWLYRAAVEVPSHTSGITSGQPAWRSHCATWSAELTRLQRVARSPQAILLRGPTGSGKEVLARAVHQASGRNGPFVAVNCAALPHATMEAELFGYQRGAFTGAHQGYGGLVAAADGGTLFLDEIGDLSLAGQAMLLRVLQEHEVRPLGCANPRKVDLRVVTATHQHLETMMDAGTWRHDLFARICGATFMLPALNERREDFGLLTAALLSKHAGAQPSSSPVRLSIGATRRLFNHSWPHNIRELEQVLATALALSDDGGIRRRHLPHTMHGPTLSSATAPPPARISERDAMLVEELTELLVQHRGNVSHVARVLGKKRQQVQKWCRRLQLEPASFRQAG